MRRGKHWIAAALTGCLLLLSSAAAPSMGSVTITGPSAVAVGDTIELVAQGTPPGGTYAWLIQPNAPPSASSGRARLVSSKVKGRADGDRITIRGIAPSDVAGDVRIRVFYDQGGISCTAEHVLTCVDGDLTAYRPQHGAGYFPFARTAVDEADEESATLGPGIRMNGNGDTDPAGEDDLIEIEIATGPAGQPFALRRSGPRLSVWTTRDKMPGTQVPFVSGVTGALTQTSLWVEWSGVTHGTATLELQLVGSMTTFDSLTFHSFRSIVMALGGEGQVPSLPIDPNHGTYIVGTRLYELGYDAHLFDEDNVAPTGLGAVYDAIVDAIQNRSVDEVVSFGYSHGAGSTFHLADRLDMDRMAIGTFDIVFTSYVDSVRNNSDTDTAMELRFPTSSAYHVNHWQNGTFGDFFLDGGPVPGSNPPPSGLDVETTVWGAGATHFVVDDYAEVKDLIEASLLPRVTR